MSEHLEFNRQELLDIDRRAGLKYGVNQLDEWEFAELMAKDLLWASLVDGTTLGVEEMRDAEKYGAYSERLDHPDTPMHMLGGFYVQSLNGHDGWTNTGRVVNKWLGGFMGKPPEELVLKLRNQINELCDEGLLQRWHAYIRLHPDYHAEEDFPPVDDNFEEVVTELLERRPLGTIGAFCIYNYLRATNSDFDVETITPQQYWSARYELQRLVLRGVVEEVPNEMSYVRLSKSPYTSLGAEQDGLDDRISKSRYRIEGAVLAEDLNKKLAGISKGKCRKPTQRGRWKS